MQEPNEPIILEETSITHVQEKCLPTPCPIRSILHLSPRLRTSIDSDEFPRCILSKFMYKPFRISLATGGKIEVRIGSWNPNSVSKQNFKGSLIPVYSPCAVVPANKQIRSVSFSVLNFEKFYGTGDKWIKVGEQSRRLGVAKLQADHWRIDITENCSLDEDRKVLKQESGYAVTHTGSIECKNGEMFSVQEAENLLEGLRIFLSFAAGTACGLTLVKAVDGNGKEGSFMWGSTYVEPWNENRRHSWLPKNDGGDSLTEAFPRFWDLFAGKQWNDTIRQAIDWYLNSNNGALHVGVVLAQAALESLSHRINQQEMRPVAKALRQALKKLGIDDRIPSNCGFLKSVATQENWTDGPEAITKIRNEIVHPVNRLGPVSIDALWDTLNLSLRYIEFMLLKNFQYRGRYINRLAAAGQSPYENVPWAGNNVGSSTTK